MSGPPDHIFFLKEDGELFVTEGVNRRDGGNQTSCSNRIAWNDEKGPYIPCSAGGYHLHRGKDAEREFQQCNCAHDLLQWISKSDGIMICRDCRRTFIVDGGIGDGAEAVPPICALEKDGKICIYSERQSQAGIQ